MCARCPDGAWIRFWAAGRRHRSGRQGCGEVRVVLGVAERITAAAEEVAGVNIDVNVLHAVGAIGEIVLVGVVEECSSAAIRVFEIPEINRLCIDVSEDASAITEVIGKLNIVELSLGSVTPIPPMAETGGGRRVTTARSGKWGSEPSASAGRATAVESRICGTNILF